MWTIIFSKFPIVIEPLFYIYVPKGNIEFYKKKLAYKKGSACDEIKNILLKKLKDTLTYTIRNNL